MRKNEADTKTSALPVCGAQASRLAAYDPMTAASESERPWPFKAEDTSPLAWWRRLPSNALGGAERLLLLTTLEQIDVLHGGDDFAAALNGDPAAAIGATLSMMPIKEITLRADIAMTALLNCAIDGNAAAALVLAQVLGLTDLDHPYATELAESWLAYGRRYSDSPDKFGEAETVLLAAFRERPRDGDDA
ncbi:hypothetical protein IVB18_07450 [Bradyrhizobium sp. 186]|uniref:hypothetical protein n=1 Tax=Bradyrhizobium sp. 186 TaxID=2782654 RepID=UPI002000FEFB|nr:hypothetical protein [Bradyrhizobium sp. 186]UPK37147.1 hypothetical protein IVB18_07450 [Bradyrhizobium sp. 186]